MAVSQNKGAVIKNTVNINDFNNFFLNPKQIGYVSW